MTITIFLLLITICSAISSLLTEGIKTWFKNVNKENVLEYEDRINKLFSNVDNGFLNTKTIYKVKKDGKKA